MCVKCYIAKGDSRIIKKQERRIVTKKSIGMCTLLVVVVTTTPSTSKRRVRLRVFFFRLLNSISSFVRGARRTGVGSRSDVVSASELIVVPLLTVLKLRPEDGLERKTTSLSSTSMTESLFRLLRLPVVPVLKIKC